MNILLGQKNLLLPIPEKKLFLGTPTPKHSKSTVIKKKNGFLNRVGTLIKSVFHKKPITINGDRFFPYEKNAQNEKAKKFPLGKNTVFF